MNTVVLLAATVSAALSEMGSAAPKACWSEKKMSDETRLRLFPVSDISSDSRNTWNVYFCQGIVSIFELFVVVPSLNICASLPSDSFLCLTSRAETEWQRWWRFRWGRGELWVMGLPGDEVGAVARLVPRSTTAIKAMPGSNHRHHGSFSSFPTSSLVTASEWPHSFILWKKKFLVSNLPAALLHTFLKLLKVQLFWVAPCLCLRSPPPLRDFSSTIKTQKCQKLPKQHFPNYSSSVSPQVPQIRALIQQAILSRCLLWTPQIFGSTSQVCQVRVCSLLWLLCLVPQCPLLTEMNSKITFVCFWSLLLDVFFAGEEDALIIVKKLHLVTEQRVMNKGKNWLFYISLVKIISYSQASI